MKNSAVKVMIAEQYGVEIDSINIQFEAYVNGVYEFTVRFVDLDSNPVHQLVKVSAKLIQGEHE